jgi:hypothetical protein|tara:strand:+ start:1618 stop:1932 length:315 start_codon:yes stop_codon:yes gene_type:complete
MRRTATRAAALLPRDLIVQIQEFMPEGGKLSIPQRGCSQRFLLSETERLAQDLEITMKALRMIPTRELAEEYEVSLTGVRKIVKRTLEALRDRVDAPEPVFGKK